MFKKMFVAEQEKSSMYLQSRKPHFSPKHAVHPRNSSSQGALEALGWGWSTISVGGAKAFASNGHHPSRLSLAGYTHRMGPSAEIPECHLVPCHRGNRGSQGSGTAARAGSGGFSLPGSPCAGTLSVLSRRGDLRGRLSPAEKLLP